MADRMSDEELAALLPDYLNNVLADDVRQMIDAYLARNPQASADLRNLQLMLEEMDRIEPREVGADAEGRAKFVAYAQANPLRAGPAGQRWWQRWSTASWWKPAFATAMIVVLGQGVVINHLLHQTDEPVADGSRSVGASRAAQRSGAVVLSVQMAADATVADVLEALRDVQGHIVAGSGDSPVLDVELSDMPAPEAIRRLKRSKAVVSVIERPPAQGIR